MDPESFILKRTADGSDTLYSATMQEAYHSLNGALQESRHVFIEAGLHKIMKTKIRVFEVGFGTGLNALLTWSDAHHRSLQLDYSAIEAFPLTEPVFEALNYSLIETSLPADAFLKLHRANWNTPTVLEEGRFTLTKIREDFTAFNFEQRVDLLYFDAFAPEKQPEMWEESLFRKMYDALDTEGILVTYCAKGEVRRRMQRSGFKTERIPGPPGKREMLRAVKSPV